MAKKRPDITFRPFWILQSTNTVIQVNHIQRCLDHFDNEFSTAF